MSNQVVPPVVGNDVIDRLRSEEKGHRFVLTLSIFGGMIFLSISMFVILLISRQTLHLVLDIGLTVYGLLAILLGIIAGWLLLIGVTRYLIPSTSADALMILQYTDFLACLIEDENPQVLLTSPSWQFWRLPSRLKNNGLADRLVWICLHWGLLTHALGHRVHPSAPGWLPSLIIVTLLLVICLAFAQSLLIGFAISLLPIVTIASLPRNIMEIGALNAMGIFLAAESGNWKEYHAE